MQQPWKITARHLSKNGELLLGTLLTSDKIVPISTWSYSIAHSANDCAALVVDVDSPDGRSFWQQWRERGPVLIPYTTVPQDYADTKLVLPKPLRSSELTGLLRELLVALLDRPAGALVAPATLAKPATNDTKSLLQTLLEVRDWPVAVRKNGVELLFDLRRLRYFSGDDHLAPAVLLAQDSRDFSIEPQESGAESVAEHDLVPALRQFVARHPGRLLPWLTDGDLFKLKRWPDFRRIKYEPKHVKIAVAIKQQAHDALYIAERCAVDYREVVDFINLFHLLGYVERQTPATGSVSAATPAARPQRATLLGKIRRRLGIA